MKANLTEAILKAITTTAGQGGDFLPQPIASRFVDYLRDENYCRSHFRPETMTSKTKDIPKVLSSSSVYYESTETTEAVATQFTTGTMRLTAKKLFAKIEISTEEVEDAAFDMESIVKEQIAGSVGNTEEECMMVGDPSHTATALTPGAATDADWYTKDPRLIFKGLFTLAAEAGAATAVAGASADASSLMLREALYNLGKYGRRWSDIVVYLNPWSVNQMLDDSKIVTMDKVGPKATILTGTFFLLYGKISIINEVYAPNGKGVMLPKRNAIIGDRRKLKIIREMVAQNDMYRYVFSERIDFAVEQLAALAPINGMAEPVSTS